MQTAFSLLFMKTLKHRFRIVAPKASYEGSKQPPSPGEKSQWLWSCYHSPWQPTRQERTAIALANFCFAVKHKKWKCYLVFIGFVIHFTKKVRLRPASVDKTLILSPSGQMFCLTQAPKQTERGVLLWDSSSYQKPNRHTQSEQSAVLGRDSAWSSDRLWILSQPGKGGKQKGTG